MRLVSEAKQKKKHTHTNSVEHAKSSKSKTSLFYNFFSSSYNTINNHTQTHNQAPNTHTLF